MTLRRLLLPAALLLLSTVANAAPQLAADLTEHSARVTTMFAGVHTVLFGAFAGEGDLIVVVTGPSIAVTVREKRDVAGLWLDRSSVRFDDVPAFYAVAATRQPAELLLPAALASAGIGSLESQILSPGRPDSDHRAAAAALIRVLSARELYTPEVRLVGLVDPSLFRIPIDLPATAPIGRYTVRVMLVRQHTIVATTSLPLTIEEAGAAAAIRRAAEAHPVLYGLLCTASATGIGWIAAILVKGSR